MDETEKPVITGQYINGSTGPITGYTSEGGVLVRVFIGGTYIGKTTSNAFGIWSLAFADATISSLSTGEVITADAQAGGKNRSLLSDAVTVLAGATATPTIYGGDTSRLLSAMGSSIDISGSGTIRIYADGVMILETTAVSPIPYGTTIGDGTLQDFIEAGVQIHATRQSTGNSESSPSNVLTITADPVRYIVVKNVNPEPAQGGGSRDVVITYQVLNNNYAPDANVLMNITRESGAGSITAINGTAIGSSPSYLTNGSGEITVTYTTAFADDGSTFSVKAADVGGLGTALVVTVNVASLSSIAITPVNPSITVGGTQQFTATGTYSDGSTANITSSVSWTSGTPAAATINASTGLATGVADGSSVITATSGSVSGNTTLTVNAAATPDRITLTVWRRLRI